MPFYINFTISFFTISIYLKKKVWERREKKINKEFLKKEEEIDDNGAFYFFSLLYLSQP